MRHSLNGHGKRPHARRLTDFLSESKAFLTSFKTLMMFSSSETSRITKLQDLKRLFKPVILYWRSSKIPWIDAKSWVPMSAGLVSDQNGHGRDFGGIKRQSMGFEAELRQICYCSTPFWTKLAGWWISFYLSCSDLFWLPGGDLRISIHHIPCFVSKLFGLYVL